MDRALLFSLSSTPMIFSDMGDVFTWFLSKIGVRNLLHYLEIFLLLGSTNYYEGAQVYTTAH